MKSIPVELLLSAYEVGVFPMAESRNSSTVKWVEPKKRGLIFVDQFYVPGRLRRLARKGWFNVSCNRNFREVVRACAAPTETRNETWINEVIEESYYQLHLSGYAHSLECWQGNDLVGGLYGVSLGAIFFGESMFSRTDNSSKIALCHLAARLKIANYYILDMQFLTKHLRQFGGTEIDQSEYRKLLPTYLKIKTNFPYLISESSFMGWLQSSNQKS